VAAPNAVANADMDRVRQRSEHDAPNVTFEIAVEDRNEVNVPVGSK
jgi:hypothetical protein